MSVRYRTLSTLGSTLATGFLIAGLGACSDGAERDESGAVTDAGTEDVFDVTVGDCMADEATGTVSSIPVVPCTEPHNSEVFFSHTIPGDTFPADMDAITNEQCLPAFQTFVGMPYDQSALQLTTLEPTAESWTQGDRELLCVVVDPAGGVTGSLQGAAR